jgi:hypothetical protein
MYLRTMTLVRQPAVRNRDPDATDVLPLAQKGLDRQLMHCDNTAFILDEPRAPPSGIGSSLLL